MSETGYQGTQQPSDDAGAFNAQAFLITQLLNRMNIGTLVRIVAVTNSGGVSPVGFVDVQPLVNQLAGDDSAVPHAVIYNVPYFRLQGGANAVILDPTVGDIGAVVFADRDISSVKASKKQANPGSGRRNDMADALYIGGYLNGTPTQYVRFSAEGITLRSATRVTVDSPELVCTGKITAAGDVTAGAISLQQHKHGGVTAGSATTATPS